MKIREACKNAGNQEPVYHIKKDELTVVFAANEIFAKAKESFEARKEAFQKSVEELNGYSSSKEKLLKAFEMLCDAEFFGRQGIASVCGVNSSNAGKLIDKLNACHAIEAVSGHGKGKYRFVV